MEKDADKDSDMDFERVIRERSRRQSWTRPSRRRPHRRKLPLQSQPSQPPPATQGWTLIDSTGRSPRHGKPKSRSAASDAHELLMMMAKLSLSTAQTKRGFLRRTVRVVALAARRTDAACTTTARTPGASVSIRSRQLAEIHGLQGSHGGDAHGVDVQRQYIRSMVLDRRRRHARPERARDNDDG